VLQSVIDRCLYSYGRNLRLAGTLVSPSLAFQKLSIISWEDKAAGAGVVVDVVAIVGCSSLVMDDRERAVLWGSFGRLIRVICW
jgi:hypothetical protein